MDIIRATVSDKRPSPFYPIIPLLVLVTVQTVLDMIS